MATTTATVLFGRALSSRWPNTKTIVVATTTTTTTTRSLQIRSCRPYSSRNGGPTARFSTRRRRTAGSTVRAADTRFCATPTNNGGFLPHYHTHYKDEKGDRLRGFSSLTTAESAPPETTKAQEAAAAVAKAAALHTTVENRNRRNASKFLALWLRDESSYFHAGLQKLQISSRNSSSNGDNTNNNNTIDNGSSSLYYDSIPSFVRTLKEGPPVNLYDILDVLVAHGLHEPNLYHQYKDRDKILHEHERLASRLRRDEDRLLVLHRQQSELRRQLQHVRQQHQQGSSSKQQQQKTVLPHKKSSSSDKNRVVHIEQQIDQGQKEYSDIKSRLGQHRQRLLELVPLDGPAYQKIINMRDQVRDPVMTIFAAYVAERNTRLLHQFQALDARTDLTRPHDWFGYARLDRRTIIFHGGPTNSGKTYRALERLKSAQRGMYLGPLRLLAAEVYEKLTLAGLYCNLYTGQETREIPFATHLAATVEMANSQQDFDVVVIDEIQMIEDGGRGYAWTRALLGSRCREIHVCGGLEAVPVVQRLVEACGDIFELRTYERFSDLIVADTSLAVSSDEVGCYKRVEKGDCVVAFSRNDIFAIKREIESTTPHKCCVVYGSLPPATRSEQARRFNDPDSGYDILVASDAIGMGLNLNIKRVILNSIFKYDGTGIIRLGHSAMKQISGRAGRRNSPFPQGEVLTRDPLDMAYLRECLSTEIKPITKAGLVPTAEHIETFRETLVEYNLLDEKAELYNVLQRFNEMANVKSDYFLCRQDEMVDMAKLLAGINLRIPDKYTMCLCPMNLNEKGSAKLIKRFAEKLALGEVCGLGTATIPKSPKSFADMASLCHLFNELELFMWLQKKFPPGNIMENQLAHSRRDETIRYIGQGLAHSDKLQLKHCYVKQAFFYREIWERERQFFNKSNNINDPNHRRRPSVQRTMRRRHVQQRPGGDGDATTTTKGEGFSAVDDDDFDEDEWH